MEEDIKILENYKKIVLDKTPEHTTSVTNFEVRQALDNLIKGYRELEKEKDEIYEDYQELGKEKWKADEAIIFLTERLEERINNYIPKSKIKEIRDKAEVMDYYTLNNVIDDLTELLGDEK